MSPEPYTPDESTMHEAYRFYVRTVDNARYENSGREPVTDDEIQAEFNRFMEKLWDTAATEVLESVTQGMADIRDGKRTSAEVEAQGPPNPYSAGDVQ